MIEDLITSHHFVGASNIFMTILSAVILFTIVPTLWTLVRTLWEASNQEWITYRERFYSEEFDGVRFLSGFIFFLLFVISRIGGWVPWKSMQLAGDASWVNYWVAQSHTWTLLGLLFLVHSFYLILYRPARLVFPKYTYLKVWGCGIAFWSFCVIVTEVMAWAFNDSRMELFLAKFLTFIGF